MKLAKLFCRKPQQIQSGVQISINKESTEQTLIGAVLERHAFLDMPAARTAFGRGKPAGGNEQLSSSIFHFGFEELQELPHRRIRDRTRQFPIGHHSQDVESLDADHCAGASEFGGELVLHIPATIGNLLMLACYL